MLVDAPPSPQYPRTLFEMLVDAHSPLPLHEMLVDASVHDRQE